MASKSVISVENELGQQDIISNEPDVESNLVRNGDSNAKKSRNKTGNSAVNYNRAETRRPRVIRIVKEAGMSSKYRAYKVDEKHNLKYDTISYADAIALSKKTGIPINHF